MLSHHQGADLGILLNYNYCIVATAVAEATAFWVEDEIRLGRRAPLITCLENLLRHPLLEGV